MLALVAATFLFANTSFAQVPDGIEDANFPRGYWAVSYYEGRDGSVGAVAPWNTSADGTGNTAGSKTFHGEAFWGIGESDARMISNGSYPGGRWTQSETPTDPLLPTVGAPSNTSAYIGTTWSQFNPHYQVDHRRMVTATGFLNFGGLSGDVLDDTLEIFVNGVRQYAYFPGGGAPDPRPGTSTSGSVAVNAGDEVLIRFINLGWIGGYVFTWDLPDDTISAAADGVVATAGSTNAVNVLTNDLYADIAATTNFVNISVASGSSIPAELSFDTATGNVSINGAAAAGTYGFDYTICAENPATNCSTATVTITVVPNSFPSLEVTKTADTSGLSTSPVAGETINFTISVVNNGNAVLTGIFLTDTLTRADTTVIPLTSGPTFVSASAGSPAGSLTYNETATYSASLTLSQLDIDSTGVSNTVTATGSSPGNTDDVSDVSDDGDDLDGNTVDDPTVVGLSQVSSLDVTKQADQTVNVTMGTTITYTYLINNIGNVTISGIALSDAHNGSGPPPVPGSETLATAGGVPISATTADAVSDGIWDNLGPGDSVQYTATYIVTQNDVDILQ